MKRTTLLADEDLFQGFKRLARAEGRSVAELMREALEEYLKAKLAGAKTMSFIALGRSGRSDISERVEELLWQEVPERTGTSEG